MDKTVVFDFDGVIHSYSSGWQGETVIADPPVPDIDIALRDIHNAGYKIVVVSTRCRTEAGMSAINDWMLEHNLLKFIDLICSEKPPAVCYVDDRAICFDGDPKSLLSRIDNFVPWNRR